MDSISPVDGRYRNKTQYLAEYFSEQALIRYRVKIELYYLAALTDQLLTTEAEFQKSVGFQRPPRFAYEEADHITHTLTNADITRVKDIERTTAHDVKAVEIYLREILPAPLAPWIHFGLTSQDVNSMAYTSQIYDLMHGTFREELDQIMQSLSQLAEASDHPMVCLTHGQPATPSTMRQQLFVYAERLNNLLRELDALPYRTKFGGATGGFNAHKVAFPEIDWEEFGVKFVKRYNPAFQRSRHTTQIDHYDWLTSFFNKSQQICTVLLDLCQDMWLYISYGYFRQKVTETEVGSSTMPHKVNPINFENAEGNIYIAVALFQALSRKAPVSRLQRDLSDSTLLRNIGVAYAHMTIAVRSLLTGLSKVELDTGLLQHKLDDTPELLTEGIQTIMRKHGYVDGYDQLKALSRGKRLDRESLVQFVKRLKIPEEDKQNLIHQ